MRWYNLLTAGDVAQRESACIASRRSGVQIPSSPLFEVLNMYKDLTEDTRQELRAYFEDRDYMVIAVPKNELTRVYTLRASRTVRTAQRIHNLEGKNLELMAHALLSALLLTSLVKHATPQKVLFKLSTQGGSVVAEGDGMGRVRGFLEGEPLCCWEGGTLTVVKELRLGTPYTSVVPLVGTRVKEALSFYFETIGANKDLH